MVCLGALLPEAGISFGQTLLGLLVIGLANPSDYQFWTKARNAR